MQTKQIAELLLALLIGVIFISSYVSTTDYNSQTSTTTVPATAYGQSITKVTLAAYSNPMYVNVACKNSSIQNSTMNLVQSNLTALESNDSVLQFYATGTNVSIAAENMTPLQIYTYLQGKAGTNASACLRGYATARLELPSYVNVTVGTQKAGIYLPQSDLNTSIVLPMNNSIGSKLSAKLSMFITSNATVYGPVSVVIIS